MKFASSILAVSAIAKVASAHTTVFAAWINDVDQGLGNSASGYIRSPPNNYPLLDVTSTDMTCNKNNNPTARTLNVKGGDKFSFEWHHSSRDPSDDIIDPSHQGPVMVYMAPTSAGTAGTGWVKIYEDGYDQSTKKWAVDKLIAAKGLHSITIPNVPAGDYLLRPEIIALHEANRKGGAQFYTECVQVHVTSNGPNTLPQGVSIPGTYSADDPGIFFDKYKNGGDFGSYPIPGPRVWTGSNTPPPSTLTTITTTTTSTTTSAGSSQTSGQAALYEQCDGVNYGKRTCQSPYVCKYQNPYYSQCLQA